MPCAPSPMRPGNTPSGIIRPAPGRRTRACAPIISCCRRRPATGSSMPGSTAMCAAGRNRRIMCRFGSISTLRPRKRPVRRVTKAAPLAPCPASATGKENGGHALALPTLLSASNYLVLAALHPVLEHLQRHRTVVFGRLGDRLVVAVLDPGFIRRGAVARQCQPHQAAGGLTRQLVAIEQHLAEHGLRLMLALWGRKAEPARAIAEIIPG